MGHIVLKDGIRIDLDRVVAIGKILIPKKINWVQYFLGKINIVRSFVTNFIEVTKLISKMLKKGENISWEGEVIQTFKSIKEAIKQAPF